MGIESNESQPQPKSNFTKLMKEVLVRALHGWKEPIKTALHADKNPDEGKLRSSQMPVKYMKIPDYPPIHDYINPPKPPTGESPK